MLTTQAWRQTVSGGQLRVAGAVPLFGAGSATEPILAAANRAPALPPVASPWFETLSQIQTDKGKNMRIQARFNPAVRVLLGALVLGATSLYAYNAHATGARQPIPPGVAMKSWQENGRGGRYLLQVIEGRVPKAGKSASGIVTSDTDCDADAEGLSHCHNIIEFPNGSRITVIDTHNMHVNPCMSPGDRISLTRIDKSWVMGTVSVR